MHNLCKYIDKEIDELESKVGMGGKLSSAEVNYGKDLAKFKMALLTNKAMEEEGYSGNYDGTSYEGVSRAMNRQSGARGRGSNARRDSMGRYSREGGYSRTDAEEDFRERLEDLMEIAPDEQKRKKIERILSEM